MLLPFLVGFVASLLANQFGDPDRLSNVWNGVKQFMELFLIDLSFPMWEIILLLSALCFFAIPLAIAAIRNSARKRLAYTKEDFFGVTWAWRYVDGKINENEIVPNCPHCSSILQPDSHLKSSVCDTTVLTCHGCGFRKAFPSALEDLRHQVKSEINQRTLRKKIQGRRSSR